jgi:hypothetical protein
MAAPADAATDPPAAVTERVPNEGRAAEATEEGALKRARSDTFLRRTLRAGG